MALDHESLKRLNKGMIHSHGLDLAHRAMMIEDAQQVLKHAREMVRGHHARMGLLPGVDVEANVQAERAAEGASTAGDDMIRVGDQITNVSHNYPPGTPPPPPGRFPRWLLITLIALASLAGAGVAIGVMALVNRPAGAAAAPAPAPATPQQPQEWEIRWKLGSDGKWQTEVVPVQP